MPFKSSTAGTKGLTLIECVISILILSVMLIGGLMLYNNANAIMSLAMQKKMALEMGIQEMEAIKSAGYVSLPSPTTGNWVNLPDKTFNQFTAQIRKRITDVSIAPVMKKVELEVSWTRTNSDPKTITLETLMSP
jgi:prepilin-type N-terminal cleavage/methylation domain-containing protein